MNNLNTTTLVVIAAALLVVAGALMFLTSRPFQQPMTIASYEECVAAGYPILESYPSQCRTPDGRNFVNPAQQAAVNGQTPPNSGAGGTSLAGGCAVTGCSQTLCVESGEASDIVTTCEYRAEYACYKTATCERQANGRCGWTQTAALRACLANPPAVE